MGSYSHLTFDCPTQLFVSSIHYYTFNVSVGVDYTLNPTNVTFPTGSQQGDQQCVPIAITDDIAVEDAETFHLQLSTADVSVDISSICNRTRVTIADSDGEYRQS